MQEIYGMFHKMDDKTEKKVLKALKAVGFEMTVCSEDSMDVVDFTRRVLTEQYKPILSLDVIEKLIEVGTEEISIELVNQVRYNGANLEIMCDSEDIDSVTGMDLYERQDLFNEDVHGGIVEDIADLRMVIYLLGNSPDKEVLDHFKNGDIKFVNLQKEADDINFFTPRTYKRVVNNFFNLIKKREYQNMCLVDVEEGNDS